MSIEQDRPYGLSEDGQSALIKAKGILSVLSCLSGQASVGNEYAAPQMNLYDLHLALWGVQDLVASAASECTDKGA